MSKECINCKYMDLSPYQNPCAGCWGDGEYSAYEPKEDNNPITHPNHYQSKSGLEVIDVIRAFTEDLDGTEAYYTGNILKYMCRWKKKNGLEELKKARQYLYWLIEREEKEDPPEKMEKEADTDCFVPWNLKPHMAPTYPVPGPCSCCDAYIRSQEEDRSPNSNDLVEMIWIEICRSFCEALKEVSKEEKENKKDEK